MRFQKVNVRFACWMNTVARTFCGLVALPFLNRLSPKVPQRTQAYLGGPVMKEPDQQEQYRPARYAREPEDPLHPKLAEGRANEEQQRNCSHSLERPYHPHSGSQVSPEPQGHSRDSQNREYGGGDAKYHAEEKVELPQVAHDARQHHAGNKQNPSEQQQPADSVAVSEPPHVGADQTQDHPLEAERQAYSAVAPAESGGVTQMRHQSSRREPDRRGDEPHRSRDRHNHPSVMYLPL